MSKIGLVVRAMGSFCIVRLTNIYIMCIKISQIIRVEEIQLIFLSTVEKV